MIAALILLLAVTWLGAILVVDNARFVVLAPTAKAGVEVILAVASLFGALVLLLFPQEAASLRLRWIAAGFVLLGLAGFIFGYLQPLFVDDIDLNRSRYVALVVQTAAGLLFAVALVPSHVRPLPASVMVGIAGIVCVAGALLYRFSDLLPPLVRSTGLTAQAVERSTVMPGLTASHWVLSVIPFTLAVVVTTAAVWRSGRAELGGWIVIAMALLSGAQLHAMFWPSGYSPVLTTSSLFRLGLILVIVIGGILELRRIAAERDALLAAEQEYRRRLEQLALMRADFTAMVAHELSRPISAIRRFAEVMDVGDLAPHQQHALRTIQSELDILSMLVSDVETSAVTERDDFHVRIGPIPLDVLLADAAAYAQSLPGDHPVRVARVSPIQVLADPDRIRQVLQNLLSNAAKYSPHDSPIEVCACRDGDMIRIDVIDRGFGIHPDDLERVFEKFGRGRNPEGESIGGVGLGLYLSRRIVQAHGSDLVVRSALGSGSTFTFTLQVASERQC